MASSHPTQDDPDPEPDPTEPYQSPDLSPGQDIEAPTQSMTPNQSTDALPTQDIEAPVQSATPPIVFDESFHADYVESGAAAAVAAYRKEKGRVRFNSAADVPEDTSIQDHASKPAGHGRPLPKPASKPISITKPRPSIVRGNSSSSVEVLDRYLEHPDEESKEALDAAARAQARAAHVADRVRNGSSSPEHRDSVESTSYSVSSDGDYIHDPGSIELQVLSELAAKKEEDANSQPWATEAESLVRSHGRRFGPGTEEPKKLDEESAPGPPPVYQEVNDGLFDGVYTVPAPQEYRGSVLSQLLRLYKSPAFEQSSTTVASHRRVSSGSSVGDYPTSGSNSGTSTPGRRKWYEQNRSQETLANLIEASARLANPNESRGRQNDYKGKEPKKVKPSPKHKGTRSQSRLRQLLQQEEARITVHIAETLSRQEYIIKLCRALMLFGAPTHRLEEYLHMTARVLEIDGQFLYLPGCMIISFDDRSTRTTEVKIVRTAQGIDLGKLKEVHHIYKEVMHDVYGVEEGTAKIDELIARKLKFSPWVRVLIFGLTSVTAGPFSFKTRPIDLPICFFLGCLVGFLQLIVAPRSQLYSNIFEISATIIVTFLSRAFGSIRGGSLFCFSALTQSGIVMLLPGYTVLCSSLELQSRAIVPGSIRMVYAIIYSLLIGFGITVGSALYGLCDRNATSSLTCENPINPYWGFIFVPFFNICICVLYQAKWRQMPVMNLVAMTGYIVNFFSGRRFSASPQVANTLGALAVGVLANLHSRIRHGVAAATLIPAIFVQVPGGLASTGGLLSGLTTANQLVGTNKTAVANSTSTAQQDGPLDTVVFNVAASMIQIAIGIAVGLFLSALIIYPLGKRRSGLFSF